MDENKHIFGEKSLHKGIGESCTRDTFVPLDITVSERVAEINERCKSESNQKKKLSKTSELPPFVGAAYVGTRNIMDGKHPYLQALKEEKKKKEPVNEEKAAAIAAQKDFFDRLSKPAVRAVKPTRSMKPSPATSNRSDQNKRFEGCPNKSEVTPSTQNRFGYKKPVPSPRVTKTKVGPKETSGDKNVVSTPVLQQKEDGASQNRGLSRTPRTSSRDRREASPFDRGRKQSSDNKTRIPLPPHISVKSNKLKESSSQLGKDYSKSTIPQSKQTTSSNTKRNSSTDDTRSNLSNTIKKTNRLPSPKRLSQPKSISSTNMNRNKSSESEEEESVPVENVCDNDQYLSNDYQDRDATGLNCYSLDRVEEKMISYRSKLNATPKIIAENKDFFIKPVQINVTHKETENKAVKTTPNNTENIFPNAANYQKEVESDNQNKYSDFIGIEDKIGKSTYESQHKQFPSQNVNNSSKELNDYNQGEDTVNRSKEKASDIGNDVPWYSSDLKVAVEEKLAPLNSRRNIDLLPADQVSKDNRAKEDTCEDLHMINRKQAPGNKFVNENVSNKAILKDERTYDSISSKDNANRRNRFSNDSAICLENYEDQQEHSDKTSPESPKENIKPFSNLRKKVRSVFTKGSDSDDSSNEIDATPDTTKDKVSDLEDEETSVDQQEHSDKNSSESPKAFSNLRKKVRSVFTKGSDSDDNSNEIDATPDTIKGKVSDLEDEETSVDQQEHSDKNSSESPKAFSNLRKKVRSVFTKGSDSDDNSNEIDATPDTIKGKVSDLEDEETSVDQQEHSDKNSSESPKAFSNLRKKVRSVFTKGSDSDDNSNEIDATPDTIKGKVSDLEDEETSVDQQEHSDKNSSESPKAFSNLRKKVRSVFTKGSDSDDNSNEIDATPDTIKDKVSDLEDEETSVDQQEHSDKNSSESPKAFSNLRKKVRSVFTKDSDSDDCSKEIKVTPNTPKSKMSSLSDEETSTIQQEHSDKTSAESPKQNTKPFRNFREKVRSVFTKDSDSDDSSNEMDDVTSDVVTGRVSSVNDEETTEINSRSSDKDKTLDTGIFDRNFIDPNQSIRIDEVQDVQSRKDSLHPVDGDRLKSKSVAKGKSDKSTDESPIGIRNGKTYETTENVQPNSKDALIDCTMAVDQYIENAVEVGSCSSVYAKPIIKKPNDANVVKASKDLLSETNNAPNTNSKDEHPKMISEDEEFQSEPSSLDLNSKSENLQTEQKRLNKYGNDSIIDLLQKLDADKQKASSEQSPTSTSSLNSSQETSEIESPEKSPPPRLGSFSRIRTKISKMFTFRSDRKKSNTKDDSFENEEHKNSASKDDDDGDNDSVFGNAEASVKDGDNTTAREDVLKPVKGVSVDASIGNDSKKMERRESDKILNKESKDYNSNSSEENKKLSDLENEISGEREDEVYNPFYKYYCPDKGGHLSKQNNVELTPTNSYFNDSDSNGNEDEYSSDRKKISSSNEDRRSTPPTDYKTPPPDIPSINIVEDNTVNQKANVYYDSDDTESLFENSSFYTDSQLSESEFPSDEKNVAEKTTSPIPSEFDKEENEAKKSSAWYSKFKALFGPKKSEKTLDPITTADGKFSRSTPYHPKMLDTDIVDQDTASNSPNWSDIIDDDVVSEDIERKLATQKSKPNFSDDPFVSTNSHQDTFKPNTTENVSRSASFSETENPKTLSKLPIKCQSLDQGSVLRERNSLKRWAPLDGNTNPMSMQEDPHISEASASDDNLSDDSLEDKQKVQNNINGNTFTYPDTPRAEIFHDAIDNPKVVVASNSPSKVPVKVKRASFKKTILSPAQARLFNEEDLNDRHLGKDNFDRTSTMSVDESNTVIKKQAVNSDFIDPINLETNNAQLVRRNDIRQRETRDRNDFVKPMESKYQTLNNQVTDGHYLPEGRNITKKPSYADSLDENLLTRIFSFLDQKTLITMPLVCQKWKRASCHPSLWQYVTFSHGRMSSKFLEKLSHRLTNLKELYFESIQGRPKQRGESEKFYQQEIRGSLEKGLEAVLMNAEGSLKKLTIINCGPVFTERCMWLVSSYARLLEEFTYHSALHPPSAEVLWALVIGCRDITKLDLSPVNPRSPQQERFNNKCVNLIAKGLPRLKCLSIGGCGIDNQGLNILAERCQTLEELELHRFVADINESSVKKLCKLGFQNLNRLKFTHTPVQSEIIQVFMKHCPNLNKIRVQVEMQDYFTNTEDSKFKQQYRFIVIKLKSLKTYQKLEEVLEFDIKDSK